MADVCERWVPKANVRKDLFGIADIVAARPEYTEVMLIQTTTKSNMSARVKKINAHENTQILRDSGFQINVHGWYKEGGKWKVRIEDLS